MRILQVHNKYRSGWGGEDTVADLEVELLRGYGHEVERLIVSTAELSHAGVLRLIAAGLATVWSCRGYSEMRKSIARFSPDIVHVHNAFPLLSPSIYWAANSVKVPVVQTLHNFRLSCANAILLRNGRPCQRCVGRLPWPALWHRCSGSFFKTASVTSMNVVHRCLGTYTSKVQTYIALTDFSKSIMVRAGLPGPRIFVKPNFTKAPETCVQRRNAQVIFVGEISRHKGVYALLKAWASIPPTGFRLLLIGDGPDRADLQRRYSDNPSIVWCGLRAHDPVLKDIAASRFLVLPSLCYENCPMVVLEAFSLGTPVIVPRHGAFLSIVKDRKDGLFFAAGDEHSLTCTLRAGLDAKEDTWDQWSNNAIRKYREELTPSRNYKRLMAIYCETIQYFQSTRSPTGKVSKIPAALLFTRTNDNTLESQDG